MKSKNTSNEQRSLINKLIEASNYIHKNGRRGMANWVMIGDADIQYLADELGVTFWSSILYGSSIHR
jgi:hypothetical protein